MAKLPGPGLLTLARYGVQSLRHGHEVATDLRARYGDVVRFGMGPMTYVFLFGRDANELVLGDRHASFLWGEALRALEPVDGPTALVLSDGDDHKRRRRLVQPAFATRRIDAAVPIIVEEVDRVIDGLRVGETVDLYDVYRAAVRRIVARVLFGDALAGRADELGAILEPALRYIGRPPQLQFPGAPGSRRARWARRAADVLVDEEIARRRASGELGTDVLGMLLATDLSDAELRDQVVSLIAAGYDTTSGAVAFAILELLRNAGEWDRARDEVVARLGESAAPTADDLRAMPYVAAAVNETLRLWPAPFSGRVTTEPLTYAGHEIPAGTTIVFSPYVTQHDPALWGADADAFRPTRWLEAEPAPYTFIPFGGAYRRCIGFTLALTELQTVAVRLLQRTSLRLADPAEAAAERGTGIAAMRPERGLRVVVESVRAQAEERLPA